MRVVRSTVDNVCSRGRAIVVMHDGKGSYRRLNHALARDSLCKYNRGWLPEAVDSIITILSRRGYHFGLLDPP